MGWRSGVVRGRATGSTRMPAPTKLTRQVWFSLLRSSTSCLKSLRMASLDRCIGSSVFTAICRRPTVHRADSVLGKTPK